MFLLLRKKTSWLFFFILLSPFCAYSEEHQDHVEYCQNAGGVAESMTVEFMVSGGFVNGLTKDFCNFYLVDAFVAVGLEAFASDKPNIAATYMKRLNNIPPDSSLWVGDYHNPSYNVCKNLGGAAVGFIVDGGFSNHLGQTGMCVFGDGSIVSGWSLVYMANHREGYDEIKSKVRAEPLNIKIPG